MVIDKKKEIKNIVHKYMLNTELTIQVKYMQEQLNRLYKQLEKDKQHPELDSLKDGYVLEKLTKIKNSASLMIKVIDVC